MCRRGRAGGGRGERKRVIKETNFIDNVCKEYLALPRKIDRERERERESARASEREREREF